MTFLARFAAHSREKVKVIAIVNVMTDETLTVSAVVDLIRSAHVLPRLKMIGMMRMMTGFDTSD